MNNDAYLRRIEKELDAVEKEVFRQLMPLLVRSVVSIRQLLLQNVPDDGLMRRNQYLALMPQLEEALVQFNDTFREVLGAKLDAIGRQAWDMAYEHFHGPNSSYVPAPPGYWLDTIVVFGGYTLRQYFQRRSPSQFMKEILRLVDRTVQRGLLQNLPTEEIARQIVPEVVNKGKPMLAIRKGTVLNAIRNRVEATIAQAIWKLASHQERQVWSEEDVGQWVWDAILDAIVCPICRELDGQVEESPEDFPYPDGNAHPRCRCRILPLDPI